MRNRHLIHASGYEPGVPPWLDETDEYGEPPTWGDAYDDAHDREKEESDDCE